MAQAGRDHCVYSTARLPARENQFQWVGPIAFNRWGVFARKDFAGKIGALDDLKPHRIGAVTFDAKADYLKENSVVNLLLVDKDADNPRAALPAADRPELHRPVGDEPLRRAEDGRGEGGATSSSSTRSATCRAGSPAARTCRRTPSASSPRRSRA